MAYLDRRFHCEEVCPAETREGFLQLPESDMRYKLFRGHLDIEFWSDKPHTPILITLLRHPVDRIVSLYYYWRSLSHTYIDQVLGGCSVAKSAKQLNLDAFLRQKDTVLSCFLHNGQARQLAAGIYSNYTIDDDALREKAFSNLASFYAVGVTDEFDRFVPYLSRALGWPHDEGILRINTNESLKTRFPEDHEAKPNNIENSIIEKILTDNPIDLEIYTWAKKFAAFGGPTRC